MRENILKFQKEFKRIRENGKTYDHGCGFCLSEPDLTQLFHEYNIKNGKLT